MSETETPPPQEPLKSEAGRVRIAWKSRVTGKSGHGEYMDPELARSWLDRVDDKFPEMDHFKKLKIIHVKNY